MACKLDNENKKSEMDVFKMLVTLPFTYWLRASANFHMFSQ